MDPTGTPAFLPLLLLSVVLTALFALAAAFAVRRILGVPVGWPRSFAVGLVVCFGGTPLTTVFLANSGIHDAEDAALAVVPTLLLFALSIAWAFALGTGLLVAVEVLWPTGSLGTPWGVLRSLRASGARRRRYLQVTRTAFREGLLRPVSARSMQGGTTEAARTARSLAATLGKSGVTFIKLGQMLSTRADTLPAEYISELSLLQTRAEPEPFSALRPMLEAALGRELDEVFSSIDTEPLASASVAQVHAAVLKTGQAVVVKIQRPTARTQVKVDLDIIERFAGMLERRTAWGRALGLESLAAGFGASLREELDYTVEMANMRAVAAGNPALKIPRVYPEFSSNKVLVMEHLDGDPLGEACLDAATPELRRTLAVELFDGILQQVIVSGVFHSDLHPGNILVLRGAGTGAGAPAGPALALLDFGSVGRLGRDTRMSLAGFLVAVQADDNVAATDRLLEMVDRAPALDRRALERGMGILLTHLDGSPQVLFTKLFQLLQRHGLGVPPQLAGALRAIGSLEGTIRLLDPGFDVIGEAQQRSLAWISAMTTPEALRNLLASNAIGFVSTLQRMPRNLSMLNEKIESGNLQVNVRQFASPTDRGFLTGLVHEGIIAGISIAAIIGSILLMVSDSGPMLAQNLRLYEFLGYTLALGGFVFGLRSLLRILIPRK
ncbi:AarF/ABC1/UbiB kinase family protein [Paeniglutamicibacter sp. ABSL32-1]|uniref:ABC1 kinase family protein n=1 Tax=Paeniglutamicibacter quisquiliarum TaxID=2849498 RepID=UPI001C2D3208|nr:AarF/UbiB family protein [Paeniglutamicibacter quisquiliarum]MBV1778591.1 AarF/ABC1/UbiB kinase family protein [Paeniglutamicibacter quisquiliarum]